jgi:hypothetical protein
MKAEEKSISEIFADNNSYEINPVLNKITSYKIRPFH